MHAAPADLLPSPARSDSPLCLPFASVPVRSVPGQEGTVVSQQIIPMLFNASKEVYANSIGKCDILQQVVLLAIEVQQ